MSIFGWTIPLNISLIPVCHSIANHASLESVFTLLYYSCMHLYHMSVSALPLAAATWRQCSTIWSPALIENEWFPEVAVTLKVPFRLAGYHTNTCAFAKLFCNSPGALPPSRCLFLFTFIWGENIMKHLKRCSPPGLQERRDAFLGFCQRWALGSISAAHREQQRKEQR